MNTRFIVAIVALVAILAIAVDASALNKGENTLRWLRAHHGHHAHHHLKKIHHTVAGKIEHYAKGQAHSFRAQQIAPECQTAVTKFMTVIMSSGSNAEADPMSFIGAICPVWAGFSAADKKCITDLIAGQQDAPQNFDELVGAMCVKDSNGKLCFSEFASFARCDAFPEAKCKADSGCKWAKKGPRNACETKPDFSKAANVMCGECLDLMMKGFKKAGAGSDFSLDKETKQMRAAMCVKNSKGKNCLTSIADAVSPTAFEDDGELNEADMTKICTQPELKSCFRRITQGAVAMSAVNGTINDAELKKAQHVSNNMCVKHEGSYCFAKMANTTQTVKQCSKEIEVNKACSSTCGPALAAVANTWGCCFPTIVSQAERDIIFEKCTTIPAATVTELKAVTQCAKPKRAAKIEKKLQIKTKWSDLESRPAVKAKVKTALKSDVATAAGVGTDQIVNDVLAKAGTARPDVTATTTSRRMATLANEGTVYYYDIEAETQAEADLASSSVDSSVSSETGLATSATSSVLQEEGLAKEGDSLVDSNPTGSSASGVSMLMVVVVVAFAALF